MKHQTVKLCSIRDCEDGTHEPCPCGEFNPCSVFKELESGRWYYEATAERVTPLEMEDGSLFDVEAWLEQQYIRYIRAWKRGMKVHQGPQTKFRRKPAGKAKLPRYTAAELDRMADRHIRSRREASDVRNRIRDIGKEIGGIKRFMRKYGESDTLKDELQRLYEERDELREKQSDFDRNSSISRQHAREDRTWENRWVKPTGKTGHIIYLYSSNGTMYEINRNGIMVDMEYVYLPDMDLQYFESMAWAEKNLGISRDSWIQTRLEDDPISTPIRHSGKKNANGRRIRARMEQTQYAEETIKFKWELFNTRISMFELHYGEHARTLYEEKIRKKIQRR